MVFQVVAHHGGVPRGQIRWRISNFGECPVDGRAGAQQCERFLCFLLVVGEHRRREHDRGSVDPDVRHALGGDDLQFHSAVHVSTDLARPGEHLVGAVEGVGVHAHAADSRLRVELEMKGRHDREEAGARAAGGEVEVGVILGVDVELLAVGGDDVETDHAFARRPVDAAVPSVTALEQIAADANALAVAGGEEQVLGVEFGREDAAPLAGARHRAHLVLVDGRLIEPAHVEQQTAVPQMVGGPAVSTRADSDPKIVGLRVGERGDDVIVVAGLHDHRRISVRHPLVPHRRAPGVLITVIAPSEVPPRWKSRHFSS